MELTRNGVVISFDCVGAGEFSYLLIHGVGANRSFFASIFEHLMQKGRVVNVDLRGHGKSSQPNQPYLMETYAEDLGWLVQELQLNQIIVIGHSMGGNIALEFARRFPDRIKGLVLLDAWLFWTESASLFFAERLKELQSPQYATHLRALVEMRCLPTDRHKDVVRNSFLSTPQHVWCSSLESMRQWDKQCAAAAVRSCRVPTLYIQTDALQVDLEQFHLYFYSRVILGKVVGSGHFCNLEVPEQVNAMLDRFVSTFVV